MLNKQMAAKFGTKEKTIKVQRGNLIKKLGAHSAADIVRLVERLRSSFSVLALNGETQGSDTYLDDFAVIRICLNW
jgi:regulatory LuxR family protein